MSATILPSELQKLFEQAIRDVIAGTGQSNCENLRELPSSTSDYQLDVPGVPELRTISVSSSDNERTLCVNLHFTPTPDGDVPVVANEPSLTADGSPSVSEQNAPFLRELGGTYAELSDALIDLLKTYADVPEENPEQAFSGKQADFRCIFTIDGATFSTLLAYPEYVEEVYREDRAEMAQHLRLPFE